MNETQGLAARKAAQSILADVLHRRRPLDAALAPLDSLAPRDAGFARAIASETLRRFGQLDALLRGFVKQLPPPHRAGPAFEIMLAGACELLFLDVAAHAAVDAANRLAQADNKAVHFKPLINAVLRRVTREGKQAIASQDADRLNTPDWLWSRWCDQYGEEQTRAIARAHRVPAPVDIVLRNANVDAIPAGERAFPDVIRISDTARVEDLPGFAGSWWVQDLAASLPARLLGDVQGKEVIDLCAAPGGKTLQLAARGARVTAVERDGERMRRVSENLARLNLNAMLVESDVRDFHPEEPAPFVLLDAPCSATGTIRRHPDLPWIKSAADVNACASASAELLDFATDLCAPGGVLVYAVCSLEREEGEEQVEAFLERNDAFAREPIVPSELSGKAEWINAQGDLRTLPSHFAEKGGMDGFYAARLRRVS